jgi:hypothetical protein
MLSKTCKIHLETTVHICPENTPTNLNIQHLLEILLSINVKEEHCA